MYSEEPWLIPVFQLDLHINYAAQTTVVVVGDVDLGAAAVVTGNTSSLGGEGGGD